MDPIVHPLDDEPEEKCDPSALGPMRLSRAGRVALLTLRFYVLAVATLVAWRVLSRH